MSQTEQNETSRDGQDERLKRVGANPEVIPRPRYRTFSREYKLRILAEADQCERGGISALLRREGLYSSTLSKWRAQQAGGRLDEPVERKQKEDGQAREIERLKREKRRLEVKLARAEAIIAIQKKASEILALDED
jgi:transposase-like protein